MTMARLPACSLIERPWSDPVAVAAGLRDQPFLLCLLSDGGPRARWSYVMAGPERVETVGRDAPAPFSRLRGLLEGAGAEASWQGDDPPDAPPFAGGVAGLAAYDLAAPEAAAGGDPQDWPGLLLARYGAVLAFDHQRRRVLAIGRAGRETEAAAQARRAADWLDRAVSDPAPTGRLAESFEAERDAAHYLAAVRDVTARIAAGEIFQANVARAWSGVLRAGAEPFDLFRRLERESPAPHAAFWGLGDHALVSNSPETFLNIMGDRIETRPIKGTRPRGVDAATDEALKAELLVSAKDRAENLMIVDLMRNDLSRAAAPGTVEVPELFAVESFPTVHHLVSTVTARLKPDAGAAEALAAAFPPGSITGAPKHQAMQVIARHEGARGSWCGSLFLAGFEGTLSSSVLIRTASFRREEARWRFRTLAGAGIVADSRAEAELAETAAKIAGLRRALEGSGDAAVSG